MMHRSRRRFLTRSALAAAAPLILNAAPSALLAQQAHRRRFSLCLTPGSIGASGDFERCLKWAIDDGFEAFVPTRIDPASLSDSQASEVRARLREHRVGWGSFGPTVDPRTDDEDAYRKGLAAMPAHCAALQKIGVTRINTWVSPLSTTMTYRKLFARWARRLKEIGPICADHNLRFGLEYIGTMTLRQKQGFPFLHTMAETKELLAEADQPALGFTLDSWHWFTAGETADDILTLTNDQIVSVDLNDAPAGVPIEQQIDGRRELPLTTGVIDAGAFLGALAKIGYDGPVRAEPFNKPLNDMDDDAAVAATAAAMKKAFALVG